MKSASIILEALGAFMLRDLQLIVPTATDVVDIASGGISTGTERLLCIPCRRACCTPRRRSRRHANAHRRSHERGQRMSAPLILSVPADLNPSSWLAPRGYRPGAHPSLHLSKGIMETET